jgi:uncharacterized damage-inducible protein DinB
VPRREIVISLEEKVLETIERTDHLISLVPMDRLDWIPQLSTLQRPPVSLGHLLGHLLDCAAGFCAVFQAAYPSDLADFALLRRIAVNQSITPEDARKHLKTYKEHIVHGFLICSDADLSRRIPTVFVADGETLLTLLLGNLEHLMNHKYQLFFYLRLAGVPIASNDLYNWRGTTKTRSTN